MAFRRELLPYKIGSTKSAEHVWGQSTDFTTVHWCRAVETDFRFHPPGPKVGCIPAARCARSDRGALYAGCRWVGGGGRQPTGPAAVGPGPGVPPPPCLASAGTAAATLGHQLPAPCHSGWSCTWLHKVKLWVSHTKMVCHTPENLHKGISCTSGKSHNAAIAHNTAHNCKRSNCGLAW